MFTTERVPAQLKKVSLDIVEMKEETRRIAHCDFTISPLTYPLALEISKDVADHLFIVHKTRGETTYEVRSEIADIGFKVDTSTYYSMTLFAADDPQLPASVTVPTCFCRDLRVKRDQKSPILVATFRVTFEVHDPDTLWRTIAQWHGTDKTFVTFVETQPEIDFDADDQGNE